MTISWHHILQIIGQFRMRCKVGSDFLTKKALAVTLECLFKMALSQKYVKVELMPYRTILWSFITPTWKIRPTKNFITASRAANIRAPESLTGARAWMFLLVAPLFLKRDYRSCDIISSAWTDEHFCVNKSWIDIVNSKVIVKVTRTLTKFCRIFTQFLNFLG